MNGLNVILCCNGEAFNVLVRDPGCFVFKQAVTVTEVTEFLRQTFNLKSSEYAAMISMAERDGLFPADRPLKDILAERDHNYSGMPYEEIIAKFLTAPLTPAISKIKQAVKDSEWLPEDCPEDIWVAYVVDFLKTAKTPDES